VEVVIWIIITYYEGLDDKKYYLFAKVHFALFYTAIFNAFQSVMVAICATHESKKLWIATETLELNHYVEIREEFQNVKEELDGLRHHQNRENLFDGESWVDSCTDTLRFPHLRRKYDRLLLQVRFHELRVHFLQAYSLPLNMKISHYLMNCELHVLVHLVHVSTVAWLLLTAAANLLYYVIGVMAYWTE
jgi:hypothetical protein